MKEIKSDFTMLAGRHVYDRMVYTQYHGQDDKRDGYLTRRQAVARCGGRKLAKMERAASMRDNGRWNYRPRRFHGEAFSFSGRFVDAYLWKSWPYGSLHYSESTGNPAVLFVR